MYVVQNLNGKYVYLYLICHSTHILLTTCRCAKLHYQKLNKHEKINMKTSSEMYSPILEDCPLSMFITFLLGVVTFKTCLGL